MSATQLARQRSLSSKSRSQQMTFRSRDEDPVAAHLFEPCAATASLFLYAQASSILCLHHDTLAIERRFEKHVEDIQLICVDNVSERGAGRLVVSYDVGQTAIVWDLFEGREIARFVSFDCITVAAWMRNGNVVFGNLKGEVILFEPSTSEHISARTIYDPITALAPSSDCKAYAIGYRNGSILLATLQPTFTILHSLTTQQAPLPIAALTWHASSSKQKSDMLATQTCDGDVRVWSVAKPPAADAPRVIRHLSGSNHSSSGRHWISWSKNGRIVQFSGRETWSWDVRTKSVTYEIVPTVDQPRGVAAYGPTATLFTLGPSHTVQQYDLERPQMVANVHHPPLRLPQTPSEESNRTLGQSASESEEDVSSPIIKANRQISALEAARVERTQTTSPRSNRSWNESYGSQPSSARDRYDQPTVVAKNDLSSTIFSLGTQSQMSRSHAPPASSSMTYPSSLQSPGSTKSARKGSRLKQEVLPSPEERPVKELFPFVRSRLSDIPYRPPRAFNEAALTPDDLRRQMLSVVFGWDGDIQDLIRDEMSRHPMGSQTAVLLSKWLNDDPDHLATMLGSGGSASSLDWMMLALSGIGNHAQTKKIGQAFVEKMLARGDIHAAATILFSLGEYDDAIEVYVTRLHFMEATLLMCLLMPQNWQRVSFLVREWGKHVVEKSEQHLAIRCFSCTNIEPSGPWTSPTAQMATHPVADAHAGQGLVPEQSFSAQQPDFREVLKPAAASASQPAVAAAALNRVAAKNPALKLITSFGPQGQGQYKFPGLKSDDRTPTNGPGITPIAESAAGESALTPSGLGSYRSNNTRSINAAASAKSAKPNGFARQRLSSIGETPIDITPPAFPSAPKALPTPADSGSDKEKDQEKDQETLNDGDQSSPKPGLELPALLTSARYEPNSRTPSKETPLTAVAPNTAIQVQAPPRPPSPPHGMDESRSRNGSRGRKPDGLSIQWPPAGSILNEAETDQMAVMAADVERSDTAGTYIDPHGDMTSSPMTGNSVRTAKSPSVSGRSIDQYISSLDEAQYYTKHHRRHRTGSRERSLGKHGERKRSKRRLRAPSEGERGRGRAIPAAKKSPSSPVSMSPEDLSLYNNSVESFDSVLQQRSEAGSVDPERSRATPYTAALHSEAKSEDRRRHGSRSRRREVGHKSRTSSRGGSRRHSPDSAYESRGRTRSKSQRGESGLRSPRSPLPMSPFDPDRPKHSEVDQALRLVSSDRQRLHGQQRSTSRGPSRKSERGTSSGRREVSSDRRKTSRARSGSRQPHDHEPGLTRKSGTSHRGESRRRNRHRDRSVDGQPPQEMSENVSALGRGGVLSERDLEARAASNPQTAVDRRRKELAAAELEARRLSLARRPSAPSIPFPGQQHMSNHSKSRSTGRSYPLIRSQTEDFVPASQSNNLAERMYAKHSPNDPSGLDPSSPSKWSPHQRTGLPATPRAMRHPALSPSSGDNAASPPAKNATTLLYGVDQADMSQELPRSVSAPVPDFGTSPPLPADLPAHPAYDRRLPTSRSSSQNRDGAFSPPGGRNLDGSREGPRLSPREALANGRAVTTHVEGPPNLPELQHLASPPPPPPAPSMSRQSPIVHDGDVITLGVPDGHATSDHAPVAASVAEPTTNEKPQGQHRRGRSINENFAGKIRSFTTRLRSTSRGRNARSPQAEDETPSPYESLPQHVDYGVA